MIVTVVISICHGRNRHGDIRREGWRLVVFMVLFGAADDTSAVVFLRCLISLRDVFLPRSKFLPQL